MPEPAAADRALSANRSAFRVLVRNAMFRRVQLAAADDVDALAALDASDPGASFGRGDWDDALGDYWDEHDDIGTDADARGPQYLRIDEAGRLWTVRQTIADPEGDHDWAITATIDLDACDEADDLVVHVVRFGRMDGAGDA